MSADRLRAEVPPAVTAVVGIVVALVSGVFGISATDWPPARSRARPRRARSSPSRPRAPGSAS
ncbi:hypothetical protein ES5_06262 [Dietzia cinnamea P4]|nr:hypothetical protein ES5_06262 [Dietzia cinnamea P4]